MPRNNNIRMIAESLTEDPDFYKGDARYFTEEADDLLSEAISEALFGLLGSKKAQHPLTQLIDPKHVKQLAQQQFKGNTEAAMKRAVQDIYHEYTKYCQYNRLEEDEQAMAEFIAYKQGKKLPVRKGAKDPREIESQGGSDWRNDDRVPKESRRRGRRGILK